jgi:hypothetical protein
MTVIELEDQVADQLRELAKQRNQSVTEIVRDFLSRESVENDEIAMRPAPTPAERREMLKTWMGSIDSDATDASTTIRETLKRAYAKKK